MTILKGMYFCRKDLKKTGVYYEYLFASFHVNHLDMYKKFADYGYLEKLFINILKHSITDVNSLPLSLYLDFWFIPF